VNVVKKSPTRWLALALTGLAAALTASFAAGFSAAAPVHLTAQLVADHDGIAPGQTIHLALVQTIEDGWHTYWRNPGDAGQATSLDWTLPPRWRTGDIVWPAPEQLRLGPLMNYGYEREVLLPVPVTAPSTARPGDVETLKAHASFLVCKDVCVPTDADVSVVLPVSAAPQVDPIWGPKINAVLKAAPYRPAGLRAALTPDAGALKLSLVGAPVTGQGAGAYFYPYDATVIDHAQPQTVELGPSGLTLDIQPGPAFKTGPRPASVMGVLSLGANAYEVDARVGPPLAGAAGLGPPLTLAQRLGQDAGAIAFAFLGGLILNLMPCVFPVLAMKAAQLVRHVHTPAAARVEGLAYLAGVVATFLSLAGALIAVRAAGQAVGWGFQLQSPPVLAGLALVMLLVALNLSGVFEVGLGLQAKAGEAGGADRGGALGAALTGVLAVAVAAPCTAPFMASAIGFALTQGPVAALAVFLALGLGMAAPFVALAFLPGLSRWLPKPGAWMETLKKVLAFPMYATAAWLAWVYAQQVGAGRLANLLAAAVLVAFAAWLYGAAQARRITGRPSAPVLAASLVALVLAGAAAFWPPAPDALKPQPYSAAALASLRAAGKPVFVNFTASWCVTCQVNERVALSGQGVADAFRRSGVTYLEADWTDRNAEIAGALSAQGRAGVPLYLVYPAKGGPPKVLPQLLTPDTVIKAVEAAGSA
jgi:thiol:disulfide interchange protein